MEGTENHRVVWVRKHTTGDPRVTFFRSLTNKLGRELKMRMSPWSLCRQAQACQRPETVLELCSGHQDTTVQPRGAFHSSCRDIQPPEVFKQLLDNTNVL